MTCRRGTKLSLITRAGWIAAAVAVAALQLGAATILPAAISDVELNDQTGYVSSFSPGTYHTPAVHGGAVIGSVLNLSTTPLGSFSIDPYYYSTANVTADYYFEWIGPSGTLVPTDVNVTLDYFATTTTGAQQVASVYVVQKGYTSYDILKQVGPTFGSSSFSGVLTADLLVNTIYDVGLHVEGDGADIDVLTNAISPFWTGPSHGSADPYISIDPGFENASAYTLALSPGIGNSQTSSAPDPATFALVGLALCAAAVFRTKLSAFQRS